ncbi:hypothetical protein Pmar_PMAR017306 [Perkinsus marinus ATCC 50983]|uniref:Uncharacterized protein n=1 Tax=Perkinsus marinus (strain ATCC 50983 / TXsc) TaxID=423536 RepID=C5LH83_PERM5|nr:hypothetical protein Pmar_PMAR017306 [Perkinsus marinus ATCC 50983]EER03892.1 hypothetical protein Pmar_PMAR017306 [Perkinsus marinus ATCC 50983]|eukprot:XP_002772076.1 hypothetical protein Pmar_PMAR017306 [Perkinsus marinus ATCC 50983]
METAVANVNETVTEGYQTLRDLHRELLSGDKSSTAISGDEVPPQIRRAREASGEPGKSSKLSKSPEWAETFDPSAMAAMMQDPDMHQLMASVFRGMENAHKFGAGCSSDTSLRPFCEVSLLKHMFDPQTLQVSQSMSRLEECIELLVGKHNPVVGDTYRDILAR